MSKEELEHPERYTQGKLECWDAINLLGLNYFEGCALKYLVRHRHKGKAEDLQKAINYIKKLAEVEYNMKLK